MNNMLKRIIIFLIILILIVSIFVLINFFGEKNEIILNGEDIITIYLNEEYIEPGFIGYDKDGNDITNEIIVTNNINNNIEGEYEVVYTLSKTVKKRKVKVINDPLNDITFTSNINFY